MRHQNLHQQLVHRRTHISELCFAAKTEADAQKWLSRFEKVDTAILRIEAGKVDDNEAGLIEWDFFRSVGSFK